MKFKSFRIFMLISAAALFILASAAPFSGTAFAGANGVEDEYQLTSGEVTVTTDKTSYAASDKITISVTNSSAATVLIHKNSSIAIHEIERLESDGSWARLLVRDPNVRYDIGPPEEFKPGENYKIDWAQYFYELKGKNANGYDNYEKIPFGPGKYRLVFIYQKRPSGEVSSWKWLLANSNEFEIIK